MFHRLPLAKKHFQKLVVHLDLSSPNPYQVKDEPCNIASQLIFKLISGQNFIILVLKLKKLIKNIFK